MDAKKLNTKIKTFLNTYKNQSNKLQEILEDFVDNFNSPDGLNKNSTPLSTLLQGLRKTDASLVKMWVKEVTNANVYLKANGNYVLKIDGSELVTNEKYKVLKWNDLDKEVTVVKLDYYKSMEQALKALETTLPKVYKTCKTEEDKKQVEELLKKLTTETN
jgi:hypothetical protein